MKRISFLFLLLFTVVTPLINAVIFECNHITDIMSHIEPETLVIFDLDDTLFKTPSMLGNDAWFTYQAEQGVKRGLSFDQAVRDVFPLYLFIQEQTLLELVDPNAGTCIHDLQQQSIPVISLSARSIGLAQRTLQELNRLGISFAHGAPYHSDFKLGITHLALYSSGVLFGGNNNKGKLLLQFFDTIAYHPKKVIFVDDKRSHLEALERAVESRGITFVGLRYSIEDTRKAAFDPIIADQLLEEFEKSVALLPLKEPYHDQLNIVVNNPA